MKNIEIQNQEIRITGIDDNDYISLTDLARLKNSKEPKDVIKNWMRLRSTLEFLGLWEKLNNPEFRGGSNSTPYWRKRGKILSQCCRRDGLRNIMLSV